MALPSFAGPPTSTVRLLENLRGYLNTIGPGLNIGRPQYGYGRPGAVPGAAAAAWATVGPNGTIMFFDPRKRAGIDALGRRGSPYTGDPAEAGALSTAAHELAHLAGPPPEERLYESPMRKFWEEGLAETFGTSAARRFAGGSRRAFYPDSYFRETSAVGDAAARAVLAKGTPEERDAYFSALDRLSSGLPTRYEDGSERDVVGVAKSYLARRLMESPEGNEWLTEMMGRGTEGRRMRMHFDLVSGGNVRRLDRGRERESDAGAASSAILRERARRTPQYGPTPERVRAEEGERQEREAAHVARASRRPETRRTELRRKARTGRARMERLG